MDKRQRGVFIPQEVPPSACERLLPGPWSSQVRGQIRSTTRFRACGLTQPRFGPCFRQNRLLVSKPENVEEPSGKCSVSPLATKKLQQPLRRETETATISAPIPVLVPIHMFHEAKDSEDASVGAANHRCSVTNSCQELCSWNEVAL